ncbi:glycosyltransferase family 43 protein [Verrucomicrobia bacterium]|nr:glycosyltransferase family 43 protein [Verrucomicrobiota bacterium]MDB4795277.1 glycosyltransferase family 43 protein [Verrucomicrobiota bacterium]MDC0317840.1 glycosyltransferase family 43 protein [bacterium]
MNFVYIITPCSRPKNLETLYKSIASTFGDNFLWLIVGDSSKCNRHLSKFDSGNVRIIDHPNSYSGNLQRNTGIEWVKKHSKGGFWIYFLDDDNIIHPDIKHYFHEFTSSYDIVAVSQCLKTGHPRRVQFGDYENMEASETKMKIKQVDLAQVFFKHSCLDDLHFRKNSYQADGILIQTMREKKYKFNFVKNYLCYYNYLSSDIVY